MFILKVVKVLCFDTLLQVLILKVLKSGGACRSPRFGSRAMGLEHTLARGQILVYKKKKREGSRSQDADSYKSDYNREGY